MTIVYERDHDGDDRGRGKGGRGGRGGKGGRGGDRKKSKPSSRAIWDTGEDKVSALDSTNHHTSPATQVKSK